MTGQPEVFAAPAKLNLFLHVVGRRSDGYHLLQTAFRFIDYGDELSFRVRDDGLVRRVGNLPGVAQDQDLCVRAARLLQEVTGCKAGADIFLTKRIPMGGGLGGGSSDAATTLLALNRLWKTGLSRAKLQMLGLRLGADVPVFVFGRSAFAEGIGEQLQACDFAPQWYVVLAPEASVSTAEIFAAPELTRNTNAIRIAPFSPDPGAPIHLALKRGHNDLEAVVCRRYPQVARPLEWLRQFGDARMSGSGACVFVGVADAARAQEIISSMPSDMRGFAARGLDRHPMWADGD